MCGAQICPWPFHASVTWSCDALRLYSKANGPWRAPMFRQMGSSMSSPRLWNISCLARIAKLDDVWRERRIFALCSISSFLEVGISQSTLLPEACEIWKMFTLPRYASHRRMVESFEMLGSISGIRRSCNSDTFRLGSDILSLKASRGSLKGQHDRLCRKARGKASVDFQRPCDARARFGSLNTCSR